MWRPYGLQLERHLTLLRAEIPVPGLPPGLEGLRILLVTDPHAGPFVSPRDLARTFRRLVAATGPDLVLVGGDVITYAPGELEPAAFATLRAPLGAFAVLGNHDHYAGMPGRVAAALAAAGITLLHNRSVPIRRAGDTLWLAGIDDWVTGEPDLDRALAGSGTPRILLSHHPDAFFPAAERGVPLVLSGHTHGGQIRLKGLPVLVRQSLFRLDEGQYSCRGSRLVVSRGVGVTGLPLRLGCPPEAVEIRLVPAPGPPPDRKELAR
jgi:hypothetical protein